MKSPVPICAKVSFGAPEKKQNMQAVRNRLRTRTARGFWIRSTPVGFSFWLGALTAFAVGVIVCYQTLYTGVVDYLPQFGILKAIGFKDGYLLLSVLKQALILSLLGFFPGVLVSRLFYGWIGALTGLPMIMTPARTAFIFVLTVGMCIAAGLLAVRKVLTTDPAEVFE